MKHRLCIFFTALLVILSCASTPESKILFDKGVAMSDEHKYTEAINYYEEALKSDPQFAKAAYNIGVSYLKLNDSEKALKYFKKAVLLRDHYPDAWYNIAAISFNKGDYKEAVKASDNSLIIEAKKIKELSYQKLAESGFPYQTEAKVKNPPVFVMPEFITELKEKKNFSISFKVSPEGKIEEIKCDQENEKELCNYYTNIVNKLEIIPPYDFDENKTIESSGHIKITLNEDKSVKSDIYITNPCVRGGTIGSKRTSSIRAGGGQAVIMGAMDRKDIDAFIRRNLGKIVWCYEKVLLTKPDIFGKIVINFIIDAEGNVAASKVGRSTMGAEIVESCIAEQIKKIKFPKPKNGKIVIVNYPFVFKNK